MSFCRASKPRTYLSFCFVGLCGNDLDDRTDFWNRGYLMLEGVLVPKIWALPLDYYANLETLFAVFDHT